MLAAKINQQKQHSLHSL